MLKNRCCLTCINIDSLYLSFVEIQWISETDSHVLIVLDTRLWCCSHRRHTHTPLTSGTLTLPSHQAYTYLKLSHSWNLRHTWFSKTITDMRFTRDLHRKMQWAPKSLSSTQQVHHTHTHTHSLSKSLSPVHKNPSNRRLSLSHNPDTFPKIAMIV